MVLGCIGTPALADMDHHCLNQCISNGKSATACMPECSYTPEASFHKASKLDPEVNHNPFTAPKPVADTFVTSAPTTKPRHESTDYKCLTQCGQDGMLYQFCRKKCTKADRPSNELPDALSSKLGR